LNIDLHVVVIRRGEKAVDRGGCIGVAERRAVDE
jgi:hypothetical protein